MTKRDELVEILLNKFGYSEVDVKSKDWTALRLIECADAILAWNEKEIKPLRKVFKKYNGKAIFDGLEMRECINDLWQAIKTVLGK